MDGERCQHVVDEGLAALPLRFGFASLDAMCQFGDGHYSDSDFCLASFSPDLGEDLGHAMATARL